MDRADIGLTMSEEEGRYALGSTRPCAHDHHRIVYELCEMEGRRAAAQSMPGRPTQWPRLRPDSTASFDQAGMTLVMSPTSRAKTHSRRAVLRIRF